MLLFSRSDTDARSEFNLPRSVEPRTEEVNRSRLDAARGHVSMGATDGRSLCNSLSRGVRWLGVC